MAAVGNEGVGEVSYPAKFDHVIGVTSVDAMGRQSSFANYGEEVDIAAPGVGVFSTWDNEEFVSFSGTSTAAAFVSGAIAAEVSKIQAFKIMRLLTLFMIMQMSLKSPELMSIRGVEL